MGIRIYCILCCLGVCISLVASPICAQERRGDWLRYLVATHATPTRLAFENSDTGIVVCLNQSLVTISALTVDGGRSFDTTLYKNGSWEDGSLFAFPNQGFVSPGAAAQVYTSVDGKHWRLHQDLTYYRSDFTAFTSLSLQTVVALSGNCLISNDSGATLTPYGAGPVYSPNVSSSIQDSSHIMLSESRAGSNADFLGIYRDSGWSYVTPEDTLTKYRWARLGPIIHGPETGHFFVLGGAIDSSDAGFARRKDYYETWDYGSSWKPVASVSNGRVVRLANPAHNFLVATVGHSPYVRMGDNGLSIVGHTERRHGIPEKWIDSLFISTDDGGTWSKDGTSFAGDTIVDMSWPSSTNGFVLSYKDSNVYLSRYAPISAVLDHGSYTFAPRLDIFPNPAGAFLNFINALPGAFAFGVEDIAGNTVLFVPGLLNVSQSVRVYLPNLHAGCYFLYVQNPYGAMVKSFIKY